MNKADELGQGARFRYDMLDGVVRFIFDGPDGGIVKEYRPGKRLSAIVSTIRNR